MGSRRGRPRPPAERVPCPLCGASIAAAHVTRHTPSERCVERWARQQGLSPFVRDKGGHDLDGQRASWVQALALLPATLQESVRARVLDDEELRRALGATFTAFEHHPLDPHVRSSKATTAVLALVEGTEETETREAREAHARALREARSRVKSLRAQIEKMQQELAKEEQRVAKLEGDPP